MNILCLMPKLTQLETEWRIIPDICSYIKAIVEIHLSEEIPLTAIPFMSLDKLILVCEMRIRERNNTLAQDILKIAKRLK